MAPWVARSAPRRVEAITGPVVAVAAEEAERRGWPARGFALSLRQSGMSAAWHDQRLLCLTATRPPGEERLVIEPWEGSSSREAIEEVARERAAEAREARLAPGEPQLLADGAGFRWVAIGDGQRHAVTVAWERGLHTTLALVPLPETHDSLQVSMTTPERDPVTNRRMAALLASFAFGSAPAERPCARLELADGERFDLDPEHGTYSVGSSGGCDLQLESAIHGQLRWAGACWMLSGGGLCNGFTVSEEGALLRDGDRLSFGEVEMVLRDSLTASRPDDAKPLKPPPSLRIRATHTSHLRTDLVHELTHREVEELPGLMVVRGKRNTVRVSLYQGASDEAQLHGALVHRIGCAPQGIAGALARFTSRVPSAEIALLEVGGRRRLTARLSTQRVLAALVPRHGGGGALLWIIGPWRIEERRLVTGEDRLERFLASLRWTT